MKNKYFYLFILSSFLLIIMQSLGWGNVREVYEGDGATGIQDSINVSGAGDTVLVHDGIYYVRDADSLGITMKDSIVLMSVNGAESCTLSGLDSTATDTAYHVIYCSFGNSSSHEALIKGFTITDGNAHGPFPHYRGGGIYCDSSSPAIDSCVIISNSGLRGGGFYIHEASPIITHNRIKNNWCNEDGGGFQIMDYSSPILTGNIVTNNFAGHTGGGLAIAYHSSPAITDNIISSNYAASVGGGLFIYGGSSPIIRCNTISDNSSGEEGGGVYIWYASPIINSSIIANNVAGRFGGGAIFSTFHSKFVVDSCFIVDNGSTEDTKSGMFDIGGDTDTTKISHSNLYYNTFQTDIEIDNNTSITISLENNFWWDTTEAGIDSLIEGPADFTPWEYDFIPGVPGEPVSIDSVRNYDNDYSVAMDSLWNDPDTLYLRIYGEDRNAKFREAAVAIIKSSIYPSGIAVALIETDTSSGIYEGKAIVKTSTGTDDIRTDDIYQTVRVDSVCDSLQIVANMDTTQKFVIYYRICPGVEEGSKFKVQSVKLFQNYPNPFIQSTGIEYELPRDANVSITIYNLLGQRVATLIKEYKKAGYHRIKWYGKDNYGKKVGSGIYFYKLQTGNYKTVKKMYLMR